MNVFEAFDEARSNKDLVREFVRLTGHPLRQIGQHDGINGMVDDATGRTDAAEAAFAAFFMEFIWTPLVAQNGTEPKQECMTSCMTAPLAPDQEDS